jgi:hypothetical protein
MRYRIMEYEHARPGGQSTWEVQTQLVANGAWVHVTRHTSYADAYAKWIRCVNPPITFYRGEIRRIGQVIGRYERHTFVPYGRTRYRAWFARDGSCDPADWLYLDVRRLRDVRDYIN